MIFPAKTLNRSLQFDGQISLISRVVGRYAKRGGIWDMGWTSYTKYNLQIFVPVKILNVYAMCSLGRWEGMMDEREGGAGGLNQFHKVQTFRFLYSQNVHFVQFETPTVWEVLFASTPPYTPSPPLSLSKHYPNSYVLLVLRFI